MTTEENVKKSMFPHPPPGYRLVTAEEELEILKSGVAINSAESTIRRCEAEIRAANMEIQAANRLLQRGKSQSEALNVKLGIEGAPGDLMNGPGGKLYILVDKALRDAAATRPLPPAKEDKTKGNEAHE